MKSQLQHSLLVAASATLLLAAATGQDLVAVKAKKLFTISGPVREDCVVLIENGRIKQIEKSDAIEIPWAAKVIDASDKTVMPTWVIAHGTGGMRGGNESMQNVPWLSVADAIDPASTYFEDALRNGVGTIHVMPGNNTLLGGSGMVVKPFGRTIEDMTVAANTGIKMSLLNQRGSRLQQIRQLRRALADVREYIADFDRRKAEFEKEQAAGAIPADKKWTEEYDRTKKAAADLVQKKAKGWLFVPSGAEVPEALRLAAELDLQIVLGRDIDEAAARLARFDQTVILDDTIEYRETDEETKQQNKICTAKLLADAGVPFALTLGENGPTSYPWWQLGTCIRNGLSPRQALEALTVVPARVLGLEGQVGTAEVGKLANLQVLTGDPFEATTWVETVLLEGTVVYERSKDPRLQYLFGEEHDKAAKAGGPDDEEKPAAQDGDQKAGAKKDDEKKR
ncbi:MAG: amidohydrolase family protein [Planctomycetes bacterium]|nr:amidohydrolase family protein [Planctomycetota bacterium]